MDGFNDESEETGAGTESRSEDGATANSEDTLQTKAIRAYLTTGSLAATSRELGVSLAVVRKMAATQSWAEELGLLRRIEQAVLDTSLTDILGTTLSELKHRLQFGEEVFDKEGGSHMRPLSGATLVRIMEAVFDKRQLIRGLPTAVTNEGSKLSELAAKLEELGRAQAARTIEMEPPGRRVGAASSQSRTFSLDEE
jgi:hypothetical protein